MDNKPRDYCVIRIPLQDGGFGWVHYRPETQEYIVGGTALKACAFTREKAHALNENELDGKGVLEPIDMSKVRIRQVSDFDDFMALHNS